MWKASLDSGLSLQCQWELKVWQYIGNTLKGTSLRKEIYCDNSFFRCNVVAMMMLGCDRRAFFLLCQHIQ